MLHLKRQYKNSLIILKNNDILIIAILLFNNHIIVSKFVLTKVLDTISLYKEIIVFICFYLIILIKLI